MGCAGVVVGHGFDIPPPLVETCFCRHGYAASHGKKGRAPFNQLGPQEDHMGRLVVLERKRKGRGRDEGETAETKRQRLIWGRYG